MELKRKKEGKSIEKRKSERKKLGQMDERKEGWKKYGKTDRRKEGLNGGKMGKRK